MISILLNLFIEGVVSDTPTSIDKLYAKYDKNFDDFRDIKYKFDSVMKQVVYIYDYLNGNIRCFSSKVYFYTLFASLLHQMYGIRDINIYRSELFSSSNIDCCILQPQSVTKCKAKM